jgi:hypothetical protein
LILPPLHFGWLFENLKPIRRMPDVLRPTRWMLLAKPILDAFLSQAMNPRTRGRRRSP